MPRTTGRFLDIRRDPHSDEVLARGGDAEAHSILQRAGFIAVVRLHESYYRAPAGLTEVEESRLAIDAVGRLRAVGYHVDCDERFDTEARPARYPTLGASVSHLAERLREATDTAEAADILTELTAPHDGILAGFKETLSTLAEFFDGLGDASDPYTAGRLRYLADEYVRIIHSDLAHTREQLADRHAPHPGRRACTEQVPDHEPERSAVCACPPPPRALPAPAPPPVGATHLRR
ncbi:hypothetical protein DCW30_25350 [Streptomyces alfalfae]|uniref:Hemerythrin-like domain-containing protein n=1 Tax=Streptomyces alfalfae TaxID=1642299 RepID=A0ABM6GNM9_9ACTN|nr:hypothetical protein [Streptomyces alfalfae]APY85549.1 hypothetical protein A7J05_07335 [Streptomyces alfalfae]AYA15905.1 hypothetical protein D3X13_06415 [Streptomyces fradiae]RXX39379.1 hypothetical protein DCW30_25350 [Streptomyces alfalfae]RZM96295.1 hypothetical protein D4104_15855 [Streptomyces alfalfae]